MRMRVREACPVIAAEGRVGGGGRGEFCLNPQNPVHLPTDSSGLFSGKKRKSPLETVLRPLLPGIEAVTVRAAPQPPLPRY